MEILTYLGCVILAAGVAGPAAHALATLYARLDEIAKWSRLRDVLALAGVWVVALALAVGCATVYGWRSMTMHNDPWIGALWGVWGALASPWLSPALQAVTTKTIARKADAL